MDSTKKNKKGLKNENCLVHIDEEDKITTKSFTYQVTIDLTGNSCSHREEVIFHEIYF